MSTTSQPTSYLDLFTDLQNKLREQVAVTATQNLAKRAINTALIDMHIGNWEKFPWAERNQVLRTQPEYNTGTVSINKGSTTLTGVSTLWATANDFGANNARTTGKIVIAGSEEVYTISAIASDTSMTLNEPFIDDNASAVTYNYFEDEYDLHADFLRPLDIQSFSDAAEIRLISRQDFKRRYPRNKITGKPLVASIFDRSFGSNTTAVRRVRFHKPPDKAFLIPYSFVTNKLAVDASGTEITALSADTDEPIVPLQYRHAIVYHALYNHYRDRKNDDRAQEAKAEYTDIILRAIGDQQVGANRPKLKPNIAPYGRSAKRPYRGRGRRYQLGTSFDELRS